MTDKPVEDAPYPPSAKAESPGPYRMVLTSEYEELLQRVAILDALEAGGVDQWEWYQSSLDAAAITGVSHD